MTFSIVGLCEQTGMVGVAISTSSIAVGSRCPWVRAKSGAVSTQNVTDPSIGEEVLGNIDSGMEASKALDKTMHNRPYADYRQVIVIDHVGNTACYAGTNSLGTHEVATGINCIAAGNLLESKNIPYAMIDEFASHGKKHLAERLLLALEAGIKSGGEEGPIHSAALLVANEQSWPLVDLRVDWTEECPGAVMRKLWSSFRRRWYCFKRSIHY